MNSEWLSNITLLPSTLRVFREVTKIRPSRPALGVCLEGDTKARVEGTAALYRTGVISYIIVSGGVEEDRESDQLPAHVMKEYLVGLEVPENVIELDPKSKNTYEHPLNVNPAVKAHGYSEVMIITSGYHLVRAYLRFLKVLNEQDRPYALYAHPVATGKGWFQKSRSERRYRICNFYHELTKLRTYEGLASFEEALDYLRYLRSRRGHELS
jgi:uncharacterized SAM-binding protein YcdF (DUF218 family)